MLRRVLLRPVFGEILLPSHSKSVPEEVPEMSRRVQLPIVLAKRRCGGKSSSSSSKSNVTTIASLFEDSENIALASLEANLDIVERKKRASYCLVAMERAFAKSAERGQWEIQREKKKEKRKRER